MKILLVGAGGQVGQAIVEASHAFPYTVVACDRKACDITDWASVKKSVNDHRPEVIINAAAYTAVDKAEAEPQQAFTINAIGPKNLAQICADKAISLFHLSTDYVFDGKKTSPYGEDDMPSPLGVYGESKWEGEQAIREILEKHLILRVSWVFGKQGHNFVKTMLRLMQTQETLRVVSDQQGCPTYAGDIAQTLLKMTETSQWGTYHYCGAPRTTWHGFAETIYAVAKKHMKLSVKVIEGIATAEYPTPAQRPMNSMLNSQKIMHTFSGIEPSNWQRRLEEMLVSS